MPKNTKCNYLLLLALLPLLSCNLLKNQVARVDVDSLLKKAGPGIDSLARHAAANAALGAGDNAQLISQRLIQGLKGSLDTLDPDIRKIMRTIDSIGHLSNAQLVHLSDTLEYRIGRLKAGLKDEELKKFLIGTLESMTGKLRKDTRYLLSNMIQATLDSLNTESSQEKIQRIFDHLLGQNTQKKAQDLIHGALQPTLDTLLQRIDKIVHKDVPFVQRQANKLLLLLGGISLAIIGFVWYQRRKYARLVGLLTYQIDKIPSQDTYDHLTEQIKNEAQKTGLEPLLRQTLKEQGINE